MGRDSGVRPIVAPSHHPSSAPRPQALPVVKVMLAGEVRLGPRRPRTVAV